MQPLIVQAHPNSDSLVAAAAARIAELLPAADSIDLYSDGFNPVLSGAELRRRFPWDTSAQDYIRRSAAADVIYWVYPEWWGGPPAILKGFLDRILRPEIAYRFEETTSGTKQATGLWNGKLLVPVITTDSQPAAARMRAAALWESVGEFTAATVQTAWVFGPVYSSTARQRRSFLSGLGENLPIQGYATSPGHD